MQLRQRLAPITLLAVVAILLALAPAPSAARPAAAEARYIVTLDSPPLPVGAGVAAVSAAAAEQSEALAEVAGVVGAPVQPLHVYRHALNGFALALTREQAARVAALPGVARVAPEQLYSLQTDRGPAFIGAAQADQRPALFFAGLAGAPGATGRVVATYAAPARALELQLFYSGLGGAPTAAELRQGPPGEAGALVASLAGLAIGAPAAAGGYAGALTLDAAAEAALFAGQLFLSLDGPAGSLRGQLAPGRGEGMLVGVLDGGINVGHPAFQDPAPDGYDHVNPLGPGVYLGVCSPTDDDGRYDPGFQCNDKLVGAYTYAETEDIGDPQGRPSPRDDDGHGSHTASTVAGNLQSEALGGPVAGVAPHASLIIYDVCGTATSRSSCSSLALVAGIDQAIANQVAVISFSIGGSSRDPWSDEIALGMLRALEAGIVVSASAGNSGPDAASVGWPASAPWVLAVAASTHDRRFVSTLGGFSGGSDALRPGALTGTGVAPALAAPTALVDADDPAIANEFCDTFSAEQAAQVAGKLVICQDYGGAESAARNLWAAGAAGAVFVDAGLFSGGPSPAVFGRPAVQLSAADGDRLRAWLDGCSGCAATIGGTTRALDGAGDSIAEFSSRGPQASVPDVLKPDVAAPGVGILAAGADYDPGAPDYTILDGTSMAAPHASGLATLVRQIHPDWTPAEVRSALMLTAAAAMRKEDGVTAADPFDRGAGRVSARAAQAGFVLDEDAAAFAAANPAEDGDPTGLNLASIASAECMLTCTFTRTLRSTLGVPLTWSIGVSNGAHFTLTTEPAGAITLGPGERKNLVITATADTYQEGYSFGGLTFTPQAAIAPAAAMPVAIRLSRLSLDEPITIATREARGSLTLRARTAAAGDLTSATYGLVKLAAETHQLASGPPPLSIFTRELTLPAGTTRLWVETRKATAIDIDLYIYGDGDGDGDEEALCVGAGYTSDELCDLPAEDLVRGRAAPLPVTIMVRNFLGSGAALDSFELLYGFVGTADGGNLTASVPKVVQAGQPFALTLSWSLPELRSGDTYIGVLTLGRSSATPGDLGGVPVNLRYEPNRTFVPLVSR